MLLYQQIIRTFKNLISTALKEFYKLFRYVSLIFVVYIHGKLIVISVNGLTYKKVESIIILLYQYLLKEFEGMQ